jgi:translation initiation factor IF-1
MSEQSRTPQQPVTDSVMRENDKGFLEVTGMVQELLADARFRIKLDNDQEILGHLSGKMRVHRIRLTIGDKVLLEISPYDLTKGRIIRRL